MSGLTGCQKKVLDFVLAGHNTFIAGAAGSGKSFLIKQISECMTKTVYVTSTTGRAAKVLKNKAKTIHSFAGIGDYHEPKEAAVMCLLVPVEARPSRPRYFSLQSPYKHAEGCQTGTLLQIHIDGNRTQTNFEGTHTNSSTTKFTTVITQGKKCIQYTDKQGGKTQYYALKVIDGTKDVTFTKKRCDSSTADRAFLFDEEKEIPCVYYRHTFPNNTSLYLGVTKNCTDDRLSLKCRDRRNWLCCFKKS